MEHENSYERFGSKGMTGTALGLAIGALGVEALGGGFDNILGKSGGKKDEGYSRYDAAKDAAIARLESQLQLRDSNTYVDQKLLELYRYIDGKFGAVEGQLCEQRVYNATNTAAIACVQGQVAELMSLTKRVVGNSSICPGWGDVTVSVTPAPTTGA